MKRPIASPFALTLTLALATGTTACTMADPESQTLENRNAFIEVSLYENQECELLYHGTQSQNAEYYEIWNMGTQGILEDEEYDTEARADLYAIFVPTVPERLIHHVEGYASQDHYHIMSDGPGDERYDDTWDVLVVVPGPNFDPETYTEARSEDEMLQQVDQGILAGPYPTTAVGSEPLVLHAPLTRCGNG